MLEEIIQNRYAVTAVILFGIGFTNLMLQQNLLRKVIGFNIMDSAVFLLLASLGYIDGGVAPIVGDRGFDPLYINPIPSGLVLTGIVVSVSITAFSLALIQRIYRRYGTIEMRELLERDMAHLDAIQFSSASSRKFVLVLPLDEKAGADEGALRQLEKTICDHGLRVRLAEEQDVKRLLAIYYRQDLTTEVFRDFDGEEYVHG